MVAGRMGRGSMTTFPAFEGLTAATAAELVRLAALHGFDAEAIAAVIESESKWNPQAGLSQWSPRRTAVGLLQWIESTLRAMVGTVPGAQYLTRDWLPKLSAVEQLPLVMKFYTRTLGGNRRPVDYYLAGWGRGVGQPDGFVLAERDSAELYQPGWTSGQVYEINKGLDTDNDGKITVADLRRKVELRQIRAEQRGKLDLTSAAADVAAVSGGAVLLLVLVGAWLLWGKNHV